MMMTMMTMMTMMMMMMMMMTMMMISFLFLKPQSDHPSPSQTQNQDVGRQDGVEGGQLMGVGCEGGGRETLRGGRCMRRAYFGVPGSRPTSCLLHRCEFEFLWFSRS